jgi:hypothetical protein
MKKYYRLFILFGLASLTSCLKQEPALDPKQTNNVVEIYSLIPTPTASPADAVYPAYSKGFDIVPTGEYTIYVSYSGAEAAPQDITVNLGLDDGARTDYNTDQNTDLQTLPLSLYSLDSWTVTIPKGQRVASIKLTFKPDQFNPSLTYALPVKILSTSYGKISSNFGTVIFMVSAKNKYDGIYKAKGYGNLGGNTTAPFLFSVECDWDLNVITAGPNSIYMDAQPLFRGGSIIAYSNVIPKFIFNTTTNKITGMANDAPGNGIAMNFPVDGGTYDSRYDPATKTIYVKFGLNNNATWRVIDTLEYCGPR